MVCYEAIILLCMDREETLKFLIKHKVVNSQAYCQRCGSLITRAPYSTKLTCRKRQIYKDFHKIKMNIQCNTLKSIFSGTIFENSKIPIERSIKLITQYL